MSVYDIDRVWQRISQRPEYKGAKLSDLTYQGIPLKLQLASGASAQSLPVSFSSGACVFGITAGARPDAVAAIQTYAPGLDLFEVQVQYQQNRMVVGNTFGIGSAVFGDGKFNGFPGLELIIPTNGQILYSFNNLSTSTINIWVVHHTLIPRAVG